VRRREHSRIATNWRMDKLICQRSKSSRGGAHHSLPGWDFMQAMSEIAIEQRRRTPLTDWMGFHAGDVSD